MNLKSTKVILTLILSLFSIILLGQNVLSDTTNNPSPELETSKNNSFPEPAETTEVLALPLSRLELPAIKMTKNQNF